MDVGERILEILKEKNMSQYKLAKNAGMAYSSVNTIIRRTKSPSIETLRQICKGLGVSVGYFVKETEDEEEDYDVIDSYTGALSELTDLGDGYDEHQKEVLINCDALYDSHSYLSCSSKDKSCQENCEHKEKCYEEFISRIINAARKEISEDSVV